MKRGKLPLEYIAVILLALIILVIVIFFSSSAKKVVIDLINKLFDKLTGGG